ncbi:DNA polymerase III subunit delta' [Neisseriaceae bacterium ESL0693]|nr:DNA polymerase III subunit delta' [Neisseriaceae bacterium ESL0693]
MIYPWQKPVWQQLQHNWAHLPHAWLLFGAAGIGKRAFAEYLAQALLCEEPLASHQPCGQCPSCHLFRQHTHPDYLLLTPEDQDGSERKQTQIKVEAVRQVLDFVHLSAHRGGWRVVVIEPAESMNPQAANALLKVLEEPPAKVAFLLVSHHKDRLLPTIKSRCQQLALPAPSPDEAFAFVRQHYTDEARALLAFHGGVPLFTETEQHIKLRTELLALLIQPRLLALLDYAAEFDRHKLSLATFLDWLGKWLFDLALAQQQQPARYYPDYQTQLNDIARQCQSLTLFALTDRINALTPYGLHTLNVKMQLEDLLIDYLSLWQGKLKHP